MHQIPAYETAVTLFSRGGDVWVYPTLNAAFKALGYRWIAAHVGPHFRAFSHNHRCFDSVREVWYSEPVYTEHDFVMRDDFGTPITQDVFWPYQERSRRWYRWRSEWDTWNGEGPVPGISCHRGSWRCWRRPKAQSERRAAACVLVEEGEVAPRPSRRQNNLPDSWDDYNVAAREDRSWKRYRKTRWKQ